DRLDDSPHSLPVRKPILLRNAVDSTPSEFRCVMNLLLLVPVRAGSNGDETQRGVQSMKILGVTGRDGLPGSTCAQNHVSVDYVRRPGCCEDAPDAGRIHAV